MESPSNNMIVNKFREGVFNYIIKPDIIRMDLQNGNVIVDEVVLKDEFDVNDYNGTIYLYFDITLKGGRYWSNIRRLQESISETIESGIKTFYPTNEFVILAANIKVFYDWKG